MSINMKSKLKKPTTEELIAGYRETYRTVHGREIEVKTFPGGWCRLGEDVVAKYRISKLPEMAIRLSKMYAEGAFGQPKPISLVDVMRMSDKELVEKLDEVARKNNINDGIEDDTVLWQQLLCEVSLRICKK